MQDQFSMEISPQVNMDTAVHNYYDGLAKKYRLSSKVIGIAAGVIVFLMLLLGYKEFTYENVFYFIKDFDSVMSSGGYNIDYIEYGTGENRVYYCYRGGVVAAEKYAINVYSSTGRKTATFNDGYVSPTICVSSKYMLAYDLEGNSFSVYNSFLQLYSESLDAGIRSAYVNDRGDFLIHTSMPEYKSVVYHYNSDFERVAAYYFVDYVIKSVLSDDGKYIYITTLGMKDGEYISTVNAYKRGEDKVSGQYCVEGALSLGCFALNNGVCLLTDRAVIMLSNKAEVLREFEFENNVFPRLYAVSDKGIVLVVENETENQLMFVSSRGDTKLIPIDGDAISVDMIDSSIYILYNGAVIKYDLTNDQKLVRECPPAADDILVSSDGVVYLCYSTRAICCKF